MKTLSELNALPVDTFTDYCAGVYEHSPWIARQAAALRPFADTVALLAALCQVLEQAGHEQQLALIRAHPDLAGRAALRGELTAASTSEQAGAGLDQCSPEELARFTALNDAYQARFNFPFIMAVKNATRHQILDAFETRIHNSPDAEFAMALSQINRIAAFRVADLVTEDKDTRTS